MHDISPNFIHEEFSTFILLPPFLLVHGFIASNIKASDVTLCHLYVPTMRVGFEERECESKNNIGNIKR